jgi:hypothetical protein
MARGLHWMFAMTLLATVGARLCAAGDLRDLYFGEALYHAYQGQFFDALQRLDTELAQYHRLDEPTLDSLQYHIKQADFSVGDFELNYRMHHRAGRAIKAVLEADVDELVRNEAAFRLARIHFQKDQAQDALQALDRIHGKVPEAIKDDIEFLRANVYLALGRPADAADALKRLQAAGGLKGFAAYNLAIALLRAGRSPEGLRQLDKAGQVEGSDRATAAIRDKSNMLLGSLLVQATAFEHAQRTFDRVRLDGPYSNQALLSSGWADVSAKNYERALVPWSILIQRDETDSAVQEAKLALPYAYSKLQVFGRAASLYGRALDSFGKELQRVDASIRSIREGKFLQALVREEIEQDREWVVRLRSVPGTPETFYLTDLMASHDFQTALQNYLDLEDLRKRLVVWQNGFDAFDDIIRLRRQNYEPLLPKVDAQFKELDSQVRLRVEQRDHLQRRLHDILTSPRPELLATADERIAAERIHRLQSALEKSKGSDTAALRERVQHLQGVLTWNLYTQYPERLTEAYKHLAELNEDVRVMSERYDAFVRARQAAVHGYVGYDETIGRLRTRVHDALEQVNTLLTRQGHLIETVAISELQVRAERLEAYQTQARYAVADSYDRAIRTQGGGGQP